MAESAAAVRAADKAAALAEAAERRVVEVSESLLQSEIINDRVSRQLKKELDSLYSEVGEENLRLQSSLRDEVTRRKATEASLHSLSGELAIVRSGALETESRVAELEYSVHEASQVNAELRLTLDAAVRAADEAAALAEAAERRVVEVSESLLQSEIINDRVSRQLKKELDSLYSEVGEENLRLQSSLRDEVTRRKATEASLHSLSGELAIVRSGALETELAAQLASEHFTLTLASIVNSRSWRLTRPLRALFRLSRGGKPRGA